MKRKAMKIAAAVIGTALVLVFLSACPIESEYLDRVQEQINAELGLGDEDVVEPTTYSVSYEGNGNTEGTVPIDGNSYEEGDVVTVLSNVNGLRKENYSFFGWNTNSDGSGTDFFADGTFKMVSEDVVLFAKWIEKVPPTVTCSSLGVDTTPTWNWSSGGGISIFRFRVDNNDLRLSDATTDTAYTPSAPLSEGIHTLYVQEQDDIGNWSESGSKTITIEITAPSTLSPREDNWASDTPILDWEDINGKSAYHVQVNSDISFNVGTMEEENANVLDSEYNCSSELLHGDIYYWRVKIKNEDGVWGDWSSIASFRVEYDLRDEGPSQGIIFYDDEDDGTDDLPGDDRFLEAAPKATEWNLEDWGTFSWMIDHYVYTNVPGAAGTSVGSGEQNTEDYINSQGDGDFHAAQKCYNLIYNGYDDWFLPSIDELTQMYSELKQHGEGDFVSDYYWSSSESSSSKARAKHFNSGGTDNYHDKKDDIYVRAVRAF